MQIFAKRRFSLGPGLRRDGSMEKIETIPNVFQEIPDAYTEDELFKDAVRLGYITIVGAQTEKQIVEVVEHELFEELVDSKEGQIKEVYAQIKAMNKDEVIEYAESIGVELSGNETAKEIKKAVYLARKQQIEEE